jgi:polyvinyl alcohol dehydrogenase (cytochrome)
MKGAVLRNHTVTLLFAFCSFVAPGCSSKARPDPTSTTAQALAQAAPLADGLDCLSPQSGWPMFGQNVCNTRAAASGGPINPHTVSKLATQWAFDAAGDISATPAVVDGQVYVPDFGGMIYRIDAHTGSAVWSKSIANLVGLTDDAGPPILNLTPDGGVQDIPAAIISRDTPTITADSVIFGVAPGMVAGVQPAAFVVALDRETGAVKWKTMVESHPAAQVTSSPVVDDGRVYVGVASGEEFFSVLPGYPCCTFRGSVVALDVHTGQIVWKTSTIEDSAYLSDGGLSGFAGAAVWATPVVDRKRGSLYVTTGNNYSAPEGVTTLPAGDHIESIMALDLRTGAIKWAQQMTAGDTWNLLDLVIGLPSAGPDWDFGSGANLFQARIGGVKQDVIGAGQKSGWYWALNPDTGSILWKTQVGPGGHLGGIHWGTAVDSEHVYAGVNNETGAPYVLGGNGPQAGTTVNTGSWAALDTSTGQIEWQIADPAMTAPLYGASVNGPVTVVNGVVFGGSMDAAGTMFALDGATGAVLWSFQSGGSVYGGPAVADGVVYWGNGYSSARLQFGTPGKKLFAFRVNP